MTAEGDNCVLMQKVAKELLSLFQSSQLSDLPNPNDGVVRSISNLKLEDIRYWFSRRNHALIVRLGSTLQEEILQKGARLFDVCLIY